jgi:O-antigen/teichoic acid export membrane protein
LKPDQNRTRSIFAAALAIIIVSPLDDIALSALFGGAFFGFGSTAFYLLLAASSTISVLVWKRHTVPTCLRRFWLFSMHKLCREPQRL